MSSPTSPSVSIPIPQNRVVVSFLLSLLIALALITDNYFCALIFIVLMSVYQLDH